MKIRSSNSKKPVKDGYSPIKQNLTGSNENLMHFAFFFHQ